MTDLLQRDDRYAVRITIAGFRFDPRAGIERAVRAEIGKRHKREGNALLGAEVQLLLTRYDPAAYGLTGGRVKVDCSAFKLPKTGIKGLTTLPCARFGKFEHACTGSDLFEDNREERRVCHMGSADLRLQPRSPYQ